MKIGEKEKRVGKLCISNLSLGLFMWIHTSLDGKLGSESQKLLLNGVSENVLKS